ncbi:sensor domain-containing diguanylate cyclase [Pleionea sediminis]|uniref:sensor domain-containing diguanylate cyclase n=1 Tax=Pleionea sediminis TaxID=2569479 RepID=UPI00118727C3|nr:sensor domain-containing diguanylate cyclase [Pleionea sediminis]
MVSRLSLLTRLALVTLTIGVLIGALVAYNFYQTTLNDELDEAYGSIEQLVKAVSSAASAAAFLNDEELASDVIKGLLTDSTVDEAAIENDAIMVGAETIQSRAVIVFDIAHPFNQGETVGKLKVYPNFSNIRANAVEIAYANAINLLILTVSMTALAIIICYFLITHPMTKTGEALHEIVPGTPARLKVPGFHEHSEIGQLVCDVNALLDKTEKQFMQERSLRDQIGELESKFQLVFESSIAPTTLLTESGEIVLRNLAYEKLIDSLDEKIQQDEAGQMLKRIFVNEDEYQVEISRQLDSADVATGEFQTRTVGGDSLWMQVVVTKIYSDYKQLYYQVTLHDVTRRHNQLEQLSKQAHIDALTDLYNRSAIEKEINFLAHKGTPFAFVLIDLNGFKQVNDVYGHDAGDAVLKYVGQLMNKVIRKDDLAGRWGGDEFVYVLKDINEFSVKRVLQNFREALKEPIQLESHDTAVDIGASMGVSFYPDTCTDLETLIRRADKAMYQAKALKHSQPEKYVFFAEHA